MSSCNCHRPDRNCKKCKEESGIWTLPLHIEKKDKKHESRRNKKY